MYVCRVWRVMQPSWLEIGLHIEETQSNSIIFIFKYNKYHITFFILKFYKFNNNKGMSINMKNK